MYKSVVIIFDLFTNIYTFYPSLPRSPYHHLPSITSPLCLLVTLLATLRITRRHLHRPLQLILLLPLLEQQRLRPAHRAPVVARGVLELALGEIVQS